MAASSASELVAVVNVAVRLRSLLARAQTVKPETTVEPALPVADFIEDVTALHDDFADHYDQPYKVKTVEAAVREMFYSLIASTEINDPSFVQVWNLLDIVLICGDYGKCDAGLVCLLLEELLDSQTTDGCRTVFDYLDSRRDRLAQKDFDKKNLIFLRACNELLRRLSRAEDAIFCGRVFFFLFRTFPLGDKSSVNLRGEFHVENTTKFDVPDVATGENDMEVDSTSTAPAIEASTAKPAAPPKPGSRAVPIKAPQKKVVEEEILSTSDLYPIFWRLQHDFSDPTRLFNTENFAALKKGLACTIAKFKKTPTVVQTKAGEEGKRGTKRKMGENGDTASNEHLLDNYNPKYLTSRDLFDLELSDLAFQRHILVQALIMIDFLLSLTDKAKKRLAALATPNKSMLHAFTLSEDDVKWATTTRSDITSYLSINQEGRGYCRMVETVLARDKNWVRWKVESCPSIVRGPVSTEQEMAARKGARDATRPRRFGPRADNSMDLSFLDEGSGGLEALKDSSRYTAPSIEQLLERVKTDRLDLEFAADEDETRSYEAAMQNAKWRALRQMRASDLNLLDKIESTKGLDEMPITAESLSSETEADAGINGTEAGNEATSTLEGSTALELDPPSVPGEITGMQD
ncbi:related to nuclear matrix protein [Ramularia collo-cygni]|uniref:Related to nuclear matrix protein n=1 Tax=Ramularia collo-cygni TaxID=112498 RepID=A0A2D3UTE1_9PEZI|nr:related to nuclear matrix protein [Ramularia collo-cygni]CZT16070.1 related to nuclear matrix protein [Ramularia collo-cygni]